MLKIKTAKQVQNKITKEVRSMFSEEQQDKINWLTDIEGEKQHTCRGELDGRKFELVLNKVTGTITRVWN